MGWIEAQVLVGEGEKKVKGVRIMVKCTTQHCMLLKSQHWGSCHQCSDAMQPLTDGKQLYHCISIIGEEHKYNIVHVKNTVWAIHL